MIWWRISRETGEIFIFRTGHTQGHKHKQHEVTQVILDHLLGPPMHNPTLLPGEQYHTLSLRGDERIPIRPDRTKGMPGPISRRRFREYWAVMLHHLGHRSRNSCGGMSYKPLGSKTSYIRICLFSHLLVIYVCANIQQVAHDHIADRKTNAWPGQGHRSWCRRYQRVHNSNNWVLTSIVTAVVVILLKKADVYTICYDGHFTHYWTVWSVSLRIHERYDENENYVIIMGIVYHFR